MTSNTPNNTERPFGYWLKAVDRLMHAEFARAFESEGLSRRDWRLLNLLDQPEASTRAMRPHKLRGLAERGWIARTHGEWSLTDAGREAKVRLGSIVEGVCGRVSDAVTPEEMATTLKSLENIAVALGWEADAPLPRKQHGRKGTRDRAPWGQRGPWGQRNPWTQRGHEGFGRAEFGGGGFGGGFPGVGFDRHDFNRDEFDRREFAKEGYRRDDFGHPCPEHSGFDPRRMRGMRGRGGARRGHLAMMAYERGFEAGQASYERTV